MKKLAFILIAIMIVGSISCTKSSNDPPPPITYTVEYVIASTGDVTVDTIMYLDVNGDEKYANGQKNFDHSFNSENGYHAKLYVSGTITNGKCGYSVGIKQVGESGYVAIDADSTSSTLPLHFSFLKEFKYSSN